MGQFYTLLIWEFLSFEYFKILSIPHWAELCTSTCYAESCTWTGRCSRNLERACLTGETRISGSDKTGLLTLLTANLWLLSPQVGLRLCDHPSWSSFDSPLVHALSYQLFAQGKIALLSATYLEIFPERFFLATWSCFCKKTSEQRSRIVQRTCKRKFSHVENSPSGRRFEIVNAR